MSLARPSFQNISVAAAGLLSLCACATTGAPATPQEAANEEPVEPAFVAADLVGKSAADIDLLLGAPALARREGPGEYRRYDLARCALIAILYPDESGAEAVRRLDTAARKSGEEKPDLDDCLAGGLAAKPDAAAPFS